MIFTLHVQELEEAQNKKNAAKEPAVQDWACFDFFLVDTETQNKPAYIYTQNWATMGTVKSMSSTRSSG